MTVSGASEHFQDFAKRQKHSLWAQKLIWSGLEIVFGDFRAFSRFPEIVKILSVGLKVDLERSGDHFLGLQGIFGLSREGENALCGPLS